MASTIAIWTCLTVTGQSLNINSNPQDNGLAYFNPGAFTDNALGTPGNVARRYFSGPGMFNTDLVLTAKFPNPRNASAAAPLGSVQRFQPRTIFRSGGGKRRRGQYAAFGKVENSAPPRLMQLALKYTF